MLRHGLAWVLCKKNELIDATSCNLSEFSGWDLPAELLSKSEIFQYLKYIKKLFFCDKDFFFPSVLSWAVSFYLPRKTTVLTFLLSAELDFLDYIGFHYLCDVLTRESLHISCKVSICDIISSNLKAWAPGKAVLGKDFFFFYASSVDEFRNCNQLS